MYRSKCTSRPVFLERREQFTNLDHYNWIDPRFLPTTSFGIWSIFKLFDRTHLDFSTKSVTRNTRNDNTGAPVDLANNTILQRKPRKYTPNIRQVMGPNN